MRYDLPLYPDIVEAALRSICNRAALIRHVAEVTATTEQDIPPEALSGLAEVCSDINHIASHVVGVLDASALNTELLAEAPEGADANDEENDGR